MMLKKRKRNKFLSFISNLRPGQNRTTVPTNLAGQSASPSVHDSNGTNAPNDNIGHGTGEIGSETAEAVDRKPLPDDINVIATSVKASENYPERKLGKVADAETCPDELQCALAELRKSYGHFVNTKYACGLDGDDLGCAVQASYIVGDLRASATAFEREIQKVIQFKVQKKQLKNGNWTGVFTSFLGKLYPLTRLSLELTSSIAGATSIASPLQAAAKALGIILQILEEEKARSNDFLMNLRRVEYQAARVSEYPHFNNCTKRSLIQERGKALIVTITNFFRSSLDYFGRSYTSNLAITMIKGSDQYDECKNKLQRAIDEYDQAVIDHTASILSGMELNQRLLGEKVQDEEFLHWLSPSYWPVEAQLGAARRQRDKDTLQWILRTPEFKDWRPNAEELNSAQRTLWIKGPPGAGKSTIAAYLIDFLRCHYPNSLVLYFFCKRGVSGLTSARSIVRTLAYQCVLNSKARSALDELKRTALRIDDTLGISFLFEKLIASPLQQIQEHVFIVLDGCDEADDTTMDEIERKFEMEVLIQCLSSLPTARTLFISRPPSDVIRIVPSAVTRSITIEDNKEDIQTYVRKEVEKSTKLQTLFQEENVDPIKYFDEHAKGVFLWVAVVIQQLLSATTDSARKKALNSLSEVPGDINELYLGVLSRLSEKERDWAVNTIRWVLVAKRDLRVEELKAAVEISTGDKHLDFQRFLEIQCGSIVRLIPDNGSYTVQIIHETFQAFLRDSSKCPKDFAICHETEHNDIASTCLDLMGNKEADAEALEYASHFWSGHLIVCSVQRANDLLIKLHQFFVSDKVIVWVKYGISRMSSAWNVSPETGILEGLQQWINRFEDSLGHENTPNPPIEKSWKDAVEWGSRVSKNPSLIGEYVGKAAAQLWLHEDLQDFDQVATCFDISLKYFQRRNSRSISKMSELNDLVVTDFVALSEWADLKKRRFKARNLGVALYRIGALDRCIHWYLRAIEDAEVNVFKDWRYLGDAYQRRGKFDDAIEAFERAFELDPADIRVKQSLINACREKGDFGGMIKVLERLQPLDATGSWAWISLGDVYKSRGELEHAIEVYQKAIDKDLSNSMLCKSLAEAYKSKGDFLSAISVCKRAIATGQNTDPLWDVLAGLFQGGRDLGQAIQIYEWGIDLNSMDRKPWLFLAKTYEAIGDLDNAIAVYEKSFGKRFRLQGLWDECADVQKKKAGWDGVIKVYERGVVEDPRLPWIWQRLASAHESNGDLNAAVETLEKAVATNPSSQYLWYLLIIAHRKNEGVRSAIKVYMKATKNLTFTKVLDDWKSYFNVDSDIDRIMEDYKDALEERPNDWILWIGFARAHEAKGNLDEAIKAYETSLGHWLNSGCMNFAHAFNGLADIYKTQRNLGAAIKLYEQLDRTGRWGNIGAANSNRSQWRNLANSFKSEREAVIKIYETAVELNPSSSWLWRDLVDAYITIGDFDRAIATCERGIGENPTDRVIWDALGHTYKQLGKLDKAIEIYEKAIDKNLADAFLPMRLGDIHLSRQDGRRAMLAFNFAIRNGGEEILYAIIQVGDSFRLTIDSELLTSLLWKRVANAHKGNGDVDGEARVYETVLSAYEVALVHPTLIPLWGYCPEMNYSGQHGFLTQLYRGETLKAHLRVALAELYRAKGDTDESTQMFQGALLEAEGNTWLKSVVAELSMKSKPSQTVDALVCASSSKTPDNQGSAEHAVT